MSLWKKSTMYIFMINMVLMVCEVLILMLHKIRRSTVLKIEDQQIDV